ncbi:amino acid adenylation domain-containing protein [Micromonospora sp. WMMB482]|nr:amino acid adenylation domain-containing protein [Micromonospora sp. WMMB482]
MVDENRTWSYQEFDSTIDAVAARIEVRNADEVVAVLAARTAADVVGVLAVARAGAAVLAIDPELPAARIARLIADSGARTVLVPPALSSALPDDVTRIPLPDAPVAATGDRPRPKSAGEMAYLVYTSGSTGEPKGVAVRRAGLRVIADEQRRLLGTGPDARVFQLANVSFDAFIFELAMAFESAGTLVLPGRHARYPGAALAERLREQRVTHLVATPSALALLPAGDLPDLAVVCSVGERCTPAVRERWRVGRRLLNLYGPAEASIWSTWAELDGDTDPANIGRCIRGVGALVLDDAGRPVPPGGIGELHLVGPTVALGYHGRPDLTADRFRDTPPELLDAVVRGEEIPAADIPSAPRMYRTGDRVRLESDGSLTFAGRLDDQVKVNGVRLEPAESQQVLAAVPGITDAAVVAVPAADGAPVLAGAYTGTPPVSEVNARLRAELPRWAVPARLVRLDAMPVTRNGKRDVNALREQLTADHTAADRPGSEPAEPADALPRLVLRKVRSALGRPDLRAGENFFAAGGHSLLAVRLVDRVGQAVGRRLDVSALLQAPTIDDWIASVRRAVEHAYGPAAAVPARDDGQVGIDESSPVSVVQTEILVAEQFLLGSAAYVAPWCERVQGPFDPDRFAAALRATAQRHQVLCTRYRMTPEGAVPLIDEDAVVPVETASAADLTQATRLAEQACAKGYDLAREQPVRLHVVRYGQAGSDGGHLVTTMIHHVACDGASVDLVLEEAWRRYHGRPVDEAPVVPPYLSFARWQRTFLAGEEAEVQRAWWARNLAGRAPVRLGPDTRHGERAARDRRGRRLPFVLEPDLVRDLEAVCADLRVGAFTVLTAAYAVALQEHTTDTECVVGTPVTVRRSPYERTVGLFVNTLPVPVDLPDSGSLTDWLRERAAGLAVTFDHRDLPLSEITKVWRPDGRPSVLFALDYGRTDPERARRRVHLDPGPVKNELLLTVNRGRETWIGELVHDTAVLDAVEAGELLDAFIEALRAICRCCRESGRTADVSALRRPAERLVAAADFDFGAVRA